MNDQELAALTDLPVLCSIPFVEGEEELSGRLRRWKVAAGAAAGAVAAAVVVVHLFVSPLDVLWFRLARRLFK